MLNNLYRKLGLIPLGYINLETLGEKIQLSWEVGEIILLTGIKMGKLMATKLI
jgi:hypothetical protein